MEYQYILKKSSRKTISVSISNDAKIIVKAPISASPKDVEDFLISKKKWIISHLEKIQRQLKESESMGFFTEEDLENIKKEARIIIPQRVEFYSNKAGISYNKIFIRCQKTRWGSCSSSGNLNFNCLLVLMPIEILDSVVVHELCHRRHMNHSKSFYSEVNNLYPDYKRCDKWLKNNGISYLKRIPESV